MSPPMTHIVFFVWPGPQGWRIHAPAHTRTPVSTCTGEASMKLCADPQEGTNLGQHLWPHPGSSRNITFLTFFSFQTTRFLDLNNFWKRLNHYHKYYQYQLPSILVKAKILKTMKTEQHWIIFRYRCLLETKSLCLVLTLLKRKIHKCWKGVKSD